MNPVGTGRWWLRIYNLPAAYSPLWSMIGSVIHRPPVAVARWLTGIDNLHVDSLLYAICKVAPYMHMHILKLRRNIKNPIPSIDAYLLQVQLYQISSWSDLKQRILRIFKGGHPNKNKNKMGSVCDLKQSVWVGCWWMQDLQEQCSLQIKARLLSRKVWNLVMLLPTNPEISESLSTIVEQVSVLIGCWELFRLHLWVLATYLCLLLIVLAH